MYAMQGSSSVNQEIVWQIYEDYLPELLSDVVRLMTSV